MNQRYAGTASATITEADTNPHVFSDQPAAMVTFTVPSGNQGTVTIGAAGGTGGPILTTTPLTIGPIVNLKQLQYTFSHSTDTFSYVVLY